MVNLEVNGNITAQQMSDITIENSNSKTYIVSFNVTGPTGDTGYGIMAIPISSVPPGSSPTIYIDNQKVEYQGYGQDANNFYVWYITHFSTHEISIVFAAGSSVPEFPLSVVLLIFASLTVSAAILFTLKKHKIGKS